MSNYYAITTTFVPGQKVRSDEVNAELTGISAGFDYLPADADAVREGKAYNGVEGGSGNSYTVTMDDTRTAYADGDRVSFKATHTNTGACSLGLDGIGLLSLVDPAGDALTSGAVVSGRWYEAVYIQASNHFQLMSLHATLITDAQDQVDFAQEWAIKPEDTLVSTDAGGNGIDDYSSLHWAAKAAADAVSTAADAVSTASDAADTAADLVQTNLDQISCDADAAATAADLVQTNLDQISCDADATATAADRVQTGLDATATANDLTQTNLDQISCAADAASTAADVVTTNADVVLTNADVTYAAEWANKAEDSLISAAAGGDLVDDYSALHWANKAAASAAGVNLPSIVGGDADKILEVNAGETGYELTARAATETATGFVELATNAEVTTGSDTARAVTPAGLHQKTASETAIGLVELATDAEVTTGSDTARAVTPAGLHQKTASETALGLVELATDAEALTGTATDKVLTPANMYHAMESRGRKNMMINGCLRVWQRAVTHLSVASGEFTADRFETTKNTTDVIDIARTQVSGGTLPFDVYFLLDVQTADTGLTAGNYHTINHNFEGYDVEHLMWGKSTARDITVSFYHAHTKTGTHCVTFRNSAQNRSYVATYTQSVSNAWEEAVLTIPGDTSGTWLYGGGIGLTMLFGVAVGSTYQTTGDTWAAGNYFATSGMVNNSDSASNVMKFAQIQVETGSEKTDFEHRKYADELAMCQRYYFKLAAGDDCVGAGHMQSSTSAYILVPSPATMRSTPSLEVVASDHRIRDGSNLTASAITVRDTVSNGIVLAVTVAGGTQYAAAGLRDVGTNGIGFDAEF